MFSSAKIEFGEVFCPSIATNSMTFFHWTEVVVDNRKPRSSLPVVDSRLRESTARNCQLNPPLAKCQSSEIILCFAGGERSVCIVVGMAVDDKCFKECLPLLRDGKHTGNCCFVLIGT